MIDLRHPLSVISSHMPLLEIEAALVPQRTQLAEAGKAIPDIGLLGWQMVAIGGSAGAP